MKLLVTGGAGFIGSAFCRYAVGDLGHSVVVLDKLTYASSLASLRSIAHLESFVFETADICNSSDVAGLFQRHQPDAVVHFAAESHVDRSISGARAFLDTNVCGTFNLLEAARTYIDRLNSAGRDGFRFLHISTDEVFGSVAGTALFSEFSPYDPSSPYSATKAASDHLVRAWQRTYGLPAIISNCSNNYGPHQFPEKLIPLTILSAMAGQRLPVYGTGANVRDWLHVDDHVRALTALLQDGRPGASYNIGGNSERTNLEVVQAICRLLDEIRPRAAPHSRLIEFVADRPGHDFRYAIDASKIRRELGWEPSVTFSQGLSSTVRWYLANEDWWRPLLQRSRLGERVGLIPV